MFIFWLRKLWNSCFRSRYAVYTWKLHVFASNNTFLKRLFTWKASHRMWRPIKAGGNRRILFFSARILIAIFYYSTAFFPASRSVRTFHSVHVYLPIGHSDGDDVKDKHHVVEPFQKGNKSLIYYDGFANCVKNFLFSRLNYLLAVFIFINTQKF